MILVLSFFLFIAIFFIILNIKISIVNLKIMNINSKLKFKIDFILKIGLYLGKNFKIFEICLNKEKILKNKYFIKIKKENNLATDINIIKNKEIKQAIKKIKIKLYNLNLQLDMGTEDAKLTAILIGIISGILGISVPLLHHKKYIKVHNNFIYTLNPIFINKNVLKLKFSGEISIRLLHIVYLLYVSLKINKKMQKEKYDKCRICT